MSRHHQWLRREVEQWLAEGLVDADQSRRILARYALGDARGWGRLVFSAIGAVLIGLGVILFFAYNWQELPKPAKLALVFGALIAAHGSAILYARRAGAASGVIEGLHALGTMLFGAGIWLVAQIYHLDEHYPTAFLVWSLGALALAWAIPSLVQAMLALFLVAFWSGVEVFDFATPNHGAPPLVVLGLLPLAWWRRSPALLFFALAVLILVTAFALVSVEGDAVPSLLLVMGATAVIAGAVVPATSFPDASPPLRSVGLLVALSCCYLFTFPKLVRTLGRIDFHESTVLIYIVLVLITLAAAVAMLVRQGLAPVPRYHRWQLALLGVAVTVVAAAATAAQGKAGGWPLAIVFNLITLGFATLFILEGSETLRPRLVSVGCLLFALVTVSRYVDLFSSLLARSAVFLLLGAGLFLVGNFYARSRRRAQASQP